jgi:dihydroflavonol-4-reductase
MIYITGASGRLGKEVLERIPDAIPLVRKPNGLKNEIVTSFEAEELRKILKNADCIIHLAGSLDFFDMKALWAGNVELTKSIVDAAPERCRIIFASSISVYGKNLAEKPATEETRTNPDSPYSKSKLEAEKRIEKHENSIILRIATIYGPGFEDYPRILKQIKKGTMKMIGDGKNRIPFVHAEDVADTIVNAVDAKVKPGTYVLAGEALTQEEIMRLSAKLLGVDAPAERIPLNAALMFVKFEESKSFMLKQKPKMTTEHVLVLASDRVFDCSKAKKFLRFRPRKLEDGIREIIESME